MEHFSRWAASLLRDHSAKEIPQPLLCMYVYLILYIYIYIYISNIVYIYIQYCIYIIYFYTCCNKMVSRTVLQTSSADVKRMFLELEKLS